MAALVQSLPQQSRSVTMIQSRTPNGQSGQQYQQQRTRPGPPAVYRPAAAPIQPYAFTSTPSLNPSPQWPQQPQQQQPSQQYAHLRSGSSPSTSTTSSFDSGSVGRSRHLTSASMTNIPQTTSPNFALAGSRDDSALPVRARGSPTGPGPQSAYISGSSAQLSPARVTTSTTKSTPDRYRRAGTRHSEGMVAPQGSAAPSGSGMATVGHIYTAQPPVVVGKSKRRNSSYAGSGRSAAADDMQLYHRPISEEARRYRRRSMHTIDYADYPVPLNAQELFAHRKQPAEMSRSQLAVPQQQQPQRGDREQQQSSQRTSPSSSRPTTANAAVSSSVNSLGQMSQHSRNGSADSARSNRSNGNGSSNNSRPSSSSQDSARQVNVPPRSSSTDVSKRLHSPSPLSKPVTMDTDSAAKGPDGGASSPGIPSSSQSNRAGLAESPAAQHLAAINQNGKKPKGKTSRLRRAFSFGSAAEFRTVTPEDVNDASKEHAKLHKERHTDDILDEEQARIARKQEEGGIGNNIYGRKILAGSTDNLSVTSTASSASIMIRKMGRGMKKGGRSLAGLFRPKSMIGIPAADTQAPETTTAAVSMVTVEAERERVNVNTDPHSQPGGGTGFPHLEQNSMEALRGPTASSERVGSSGTDNSVSRKSIVGGEGERAEVLAGVRKGILKHPGSNSPSPHPQENNNGGPFELPNVPAISDSPNSSAPSTPNSDAQGHKRSDSVAIGSEDYFMSALRLRQDTKSAPNTPNGTAKRNATFSPRIVFHDTWPSQEYDRRGEVATCNRLTPMLAQQIKEELNNFKMEMEVHETSKIYTHFF